METAEVSAEALAAETGLHVNSIWNYIAGRRVPKRSVIVMWASLCDVDLAWLEHGAPQEAVVRERAAKASTSARRKR